MRMFNEARQRMRGTVAPLKIPYDTDERIDCVALA